MDDLPSFLKSGERARLFPVLAETSKEGRALSIVLSVFSCVEEFGAVLLSSIGQKVGARTKVNVYTEVVFEKEESAARRPDGLICLTTNTRSWSALVEAKIGNSLLDSSQIEDYLQIARDNKIDAVITLSNQFTARPEHHPLELPKSSLKKVALYHWSWMFIVTQAMQLLSVKSVSDRDQELILSELVRFLTHSSTGIHGFGRMPSTWNKITAAVLSDTPLSKSSEDVKEVIKAWHQEAQDLCLIMGRLLSADATVRLTRAHHDDPQQRIIDDCKLLVERKRLSCSLDIQNAASPLAIETDIPTRSIRISMDLNAPDDRKSPQARINWLLRQLTSCASEDVHIRAIRPGRAAVTQALLHETRENINVLIGDHHKRTITSFEILLIRQLGRKFSGAQTFIDGLENALSDFYQHVGQHLRPWVPRAPRLKKDKVEPGDVSAAAIQLAYEISTNDEAREENVGSEKDVGSQE